VSRRQDATTTDPVFLAGHRSGVVGKANLRCWGHGRFCRSTWFKSAGWTADSGLRLNLPVRNGVLGRTVRNDLALTGHYEYKASLTVGGSGASGLIAESHSMRSIAVMNQKGGVGKTTSSVNLAAALARQGRNVCVIDLDPQGHASFHLGVEAVGEMLTVYDVFAGDTTLDEVRQLVGDNLSLVPSNIDLAASEVELANTAGREFLLRNAMQHWKDQNRFDYVIMDCPPSLGVLTINALTAVGEVFIPLQPHFFALQGLSKLFETTALVTRRLNRDLKVSGVILCLYESGTRLAADVTADLKEFLRSSDANTPWSAARVFRTRVRRNIKLAEAPSFGQSVFDYAPSCPGALDYGNLGQEVLAMEVADASPASDATPVNKAA
jgi:chromosome partitioning protein